MTELEKGELFAKNLKLLMKACKFSDAIIIARREDDKRVLLTHLDSEKPDELIKVTAKALIEGYKQMATSTESYMIITNKNEEP